MSAVSLIMAHRNEYEELDEEVRELLQNYKYKKATVYEPCTQKNVRECLIGLSEECGLLNINYTFNPYVDIDGSNITLGSLVNLINASWTLLHHYKNTKEKADSLSEQNHIYEHQNNQLNSTLSKLKEKLQSEKNESRACIASAQRISDRSEEVHQKLTETKANLFKVSKQKEGVERNLRNEIARLRQENNKLMDRLRIKSNIHVSCSEICDSRISHLKDQHKKHLSIISQLQKNNQELLQEVLTLKEEIIVGAMQSYDLDEQT